MNAAEVVLLTANPAPAALVPALCDDSMFFGLLVLPQLVWLRNSDAGGVLVNADIVYSPNQIY